MTSDWRISPDERGKYETYFQQCGPVNGFLSGEQARDFFVRSSLPGEILRKIWDLADLTGDGRLDKREFAIACHLISSQVQKKGPLPTTLPASLIADASTTTTINGQSITTSTSTFPTTPAVGLLSKVPQSPLNVPPVPISSQIRSKYLQQFHSLVDVSKTNGFMTGLQAKNILQQTGLSHMILHQIWNLADHDRDGRLTAEEFVVAMHCCDIVRSGQILPITLPDDWLTNTNVHRERTDSIVKTTTPTTFAALNQQLKDSFGVGSSTVETSNSPSNSETSETETKSSALTYEEKRLKNYEDGNRELERRRQLLREQEEREQKEREERERKREIQLQKQKEEQERKKQLEIERQLEKQRQIEQQREEERRKLFEQREAARKELERKNRLEWERQRMQELSNQKSRLLDQINDLKSREKALELELQSMDDTTQTCLRKIEQTNGIIHSMDESLITIQRNIETERNQLETIEEKKRSLTFKSSALQSERESLDETVNQLQQSKEFGMTNRESEIMKTFETQIEQAKQENARIDEEISLTHDQSKIFQNQIEQLQIQLEELEKEAKTQKPVSPIQTPTAPNVIPIGFANFANFDDQTTINPSNVVNDDPFQTVDPFAAHNDLASSPASTDWFQPTQQVISTDVIDPFTSKPEVNLVPTTTVPSPRIKKAAPKANLPNKDQPPQTITADPWGTPSFSNSNGQGWAQFNDNNNNKDTSSPFGSETDWSQNIPTSNGKSSTGIVKYRVLYDYVPERPDEMTISAGDIIIVDLSKQQDDHWLFGEIGENKKGVFPVAYTELITTEMKSPTSDTPSFDTTSTLTVGSYVVAIADCQGKTVDKHLSFLKGDTITVREQKDASWYSGYLRGKIGWFPRNHVRPATEVEIENLRNSNPTTPTSESLNGISKLSKQIKLPVYEAIYTYEAVDPSDLSFEVGEKILVLKDEGDWWTGRISNRIGTFPNNYVQLVQLENEANETVIANMSCENTEEGHLIFEKDQTIIIRAKTNHGWFLGEIQLPDETSRIGWFPSNFVQSSKTSTPTSTTKEPTRYVAIFPYDAQQDDELSFPADAILEILDSTITSGWFKAKLGDQVGLIPSTYVQVLDIPQP